MKIKLKIEDQILRRYLDVECPKDIQVTRFLSLIKILVSIGPWKFLTYAKLSLEMNNN